jgi:hypothetical protein
MVLAMFSDDDKPHPNWEMNPSTQRKFVICCVLVLIAVLVGNFIFGSPDHFWNNGRPDVIASLAQ